MNTKKVFPGRASRLQSILLAVVIVTLLFGSLPTGEAAAWTVSSPSGSPGWSSQMQLDIGDITQPYGTHLTVWSSYGPAVRGSPAYAGTQNVKVVYVLEQWVVDYAGHLSWQTVQWKEHYSQIGSGSFTFFPPPKFELPVQYSGYFRVRYSIGWYATNGVLLGAVQILPNQPNDYVCYGYSNTRLCQPFAGSFRVGKYGTNSW